MSAGAVLLVIEFLAVDDEEAEADEGERKGRVGVVCRR
jgi:hypothetical protein